MKTIFILGLGETLKFFQDFDSPKIGVNDIWAKVKTEIVVCVDPPARFTPSRLEIIKNCQPKMFYSNLDDWRAFKTCHYWKSPTHGIRENEIFNQKVIYHSLNSPFVACSIAFLLGYTEIVLFGVDFLTHSKLKGASIMSKILKDFSWLIEAYKTRGVKLFVGHPGSRLSEILPVWPRKNDPDRLRVMPFVEISKS